jgi:curved DNA-binding protein CbpA
MPPSDDCYCEPREDWRVGFRFLNSTAYRRALLDHPDKNKAAEAEVKFIQLLAAYEVLRDPLKRRLYEQGLNGRRKSHHQHQHWKHQQQPQEGERQRETAAAAAAAERKRVEREEAEAAVAAAKREQMLEAKRLIKAANDRVEQERRLREQQEHQRRQEREQEQRQRRQEIVHERHQRRQEILEERRLRHQEIVQERHQRRQEQQQERHQRLREQQQENSRRRVRAVSRCAGRRCGGIAPPCQETQDTDRI